MVNEDNEFALIYGIVLQDTLNKSAREIEDKTFLTIYEKIKLTAMKHMRDVMIKRGLPCSELRYYVDNVANNFINIRYEQGGISYEEHAAFDWK